MTYGPARTLPGHNIKITTNPDTEPFWEAAKAHRLTACQCGDCGQYRMPPSPYCPNCQSTSTLTPFRADHTEAPARLSRPGVRL